MDGFSRFVMVISLIAILALLVAAPVYAFFKRPKPAVSYVTEISKRNYQQEILQSDIPVFIAFYATWCGPCRRQAPVVEDVAKKFIGKVKFAKVDIDQNHDLADAHNVTSIPTLVVLKPKDQGSYTSFGFHDSEKLERFIKDGLK